MKNIDVKDLSYQPKTAPKPILDQVSYTFSEGHMTALLGPNGSGKTTLLRHFLSQIRVSSDAVRIDGKAVRDYQPKALGQILAWVPQSAFAVEDVVQMARYPYKSTWESDNAEDEKIVTEAMERVGIAHLRKRQFQSLSGGEKQRVLIARALCQTTPWILLDEPTSNLDVKHQIQIMKMLREMVDEKKISVIVVMHDFNMVARYCDQAILLKKGNVVAKGAVEDVLKREILRDVYEVDFDILDKDGKKIYFAREDSGNCDTMGE